MSAQKNVLFIHGTWENGTKAWEEMAPEMEKRGFCVHTPTLRHHELPFLEGALKIANLSLLDYVEDLSRHLQELESPPLLVGCSMGGLLAQLVAARNPHVGVILLAPAPAYGMFPFYPSMMRIFFNHFVQGGFWHKALFPEWETFRWGVVNEQSEDYALEFYKTLCTESGRAYAEMALWFFDAKRASHVDVNAINTPVLVFGGGKDRVVHPRIARLTAKRYNNGSYIHLPKSDHMMMVGAELKNTMQHIEQWLAVNNLSKAASI